MNEMEESAAIKIKDENGKEKIYYKLSEISIKENNYVLYTDYSKDEGLINIYYGMLDNNVIKTVDNEENKAIIEKYIEEINEDIAGKMKF